MNDEAERPTIGIQKVPIAELSTKRDQPRSYFDKEALESLAENMQRNGVIVPLLVTRDKKIVSGERRFRAAKMAGLTEVPVIYIEGQSFEKALADNILREGLTAIEKAEGLKKLYNQLKVDTSLTQAQFGKAYGLKKATISEYISVADMEPKIKKMFRNEPEAAFRKLKEIAAIKDKEKQWEAAERYKKSLGAGTRDRSRQPEAATRKVEKFIEEIKKIPKQWGRPVGWSDEEKQTHIERLKELRNELDNLLNQYDR